MGNREAAIKRHNWRLMYVRCSSLIDDVGDTRHKRKLARLRPLKVLFLF